MNGDIETLELTARSSNPRETIYQRVERIIRGYPGEFEISDIAREYTKETGKVAGRSVRKEIENVINKLRHRNPPEIDVNEEGKGSRSGIYKMQPH